MARWARRVGFLLALAVLALVSVPVARVLPLLVDDRALDRIVVGVVLDWKDFGEPKARERLQFELDHAGIGTQVSDEMCGFSVEPDETRIVACRWSVRLDVPFFRREFPLHFESIARLDRHGGLVR